MRGQFWIIKWLGCYRINDFVSRLKARVFGVERNTNHVELSYNSYIFLLSKHICKRMWQEHSVIQNLFEFEFFIVCCQRRSIIDAEKRHSGVTLWSNSGPSINKRQTASRMAKRVRKSWRKPGGMNNRQHHYSSIFVLVQCV